MMKAPRRRAYKQWLPRVLLGYHHQNGNPGSDFCSSPLGAELSSLRGVIESPGSMFFFHLITRITPGTNFEGACRDVIMHKLYYSILSNHFAWLNI